MWSKQKILWIYNYAVDFDSYFFLFALSLFCCHHPALILFLCALVLSIKR